jgi:anti-anti-sigma factor
MVHSRRSEQVSNKIEQPRMRFEDFRIEEVGSDDHRRYELSGDLDLAQTDKLRAVLVTLGDTESVVLDTTQLTFIDTSGLAALVEVRDKVGPSRFTLIEGDATRRILDITGMREHFGLGGHDPAGGQPET